VIDQPASDRMSHSYALADRSLNTLAGEFASGLFFVLICFNCDPGVPALTSQLPVSGSWSTESKLCLTQSVARFEVHDAIIVFSRFYLFQPQNTASVYMPGAGAGQQQPYATQYQYAASVPWAGNVALPTQLPAAQIDTSGFRQPKSQICTYWAQGHCKKGPNCSFLHSSGDPSQIFM